MDLHSTLARCHVVAGNAAETIATMNRVLDAPGIGAKHRARVLILAAQTHFSLGELDAVNRVATDALTVGSEAGDTWAMGWALLMVALVSMGRGQLS